jgi:hypothetical protein
MLMPPYWNDDYYRNMHQDASQAINDRHFANGWMHYRMWGIREHRVDGNKLNEKDILYRYRVRDQLHRNPAKVNCVIAAWSGPRRDQFDPYAEDRTYYLRAQLKSLQKLEHRLDQITIVVPENEDEPESYTQFIASLPVSIGESKLVVIRKENYGQSYGSYSHVYGEYRNQFDYYIFIEDDYIFIEDNFDTELVVDHRVFHNCGFLCSLVMEDINTPEIHAAIANGIADSSSLQLIWDKYGELPHSNWGKAELNEKTKYNTGPQIQFSHAFLEVGKGLYDLIFKYCAPFLAVDLSDKKTLKVFASHRKKTILAPVQFLDELKQREFLPILQSAKP